MDNKPTILTHSPQIPQDLALTTLITCFLFGIISIFLFDLHSWGLNVVVYGFLLLASLLLLRWLGKIPLTLLEYLLIIGSLFFIVALVWRDSLVLNSLSLLSLLAIAQLAFFIGCQRGLQHFYLSQILFNLMFFIFYSVGSFYQLIVREIQWQNIMLPWGKWGTGILRGLAITIPLLIIFGFLFATSDARFEAAIKQILSWSMNWEIETGIRYGIVFIGGSWIAAVILRAGVLNQGFISTSTEIIETPASKLATIEVFIILAALNLLFASFIAVQFTYFFGGDVLVQSIDGPTYATYARRGFFQLVMVAILVMTLLLIIHWLYQPTRLKLIRFFQWLAIIIIFMTLIIEASAAHRMYLYMRVYGLTELRFYTSIFMGWLVILLIGFVFTVLRQQRAQFTLVALFTGLMVIGLLHVINPDAQIAQVNLAQLSPQSEQLQQSKEQKKEQQFDAAYLTSLSADAIPSLIKQLPKIPQQQRCHLHRLLTKHPVFLDKTSDWRNWHWSHYQARQQWLASSLEGC
jgi:hypothetical protein